MQAPISMPRKSIAVLCLLGVLICGGCCGHLMPRWLRGPDVPPPPAPAEGEPMVLREEWRIEGFASGLALNSGEIYAINAWGSPQGPRARVRRVSADGQVLGKVLLAPQIGNGDDLCLVRCAGEDLPRIISWFDPWGSFVSAYQGDGELLWEYEVDTGLNEIGAADLDGDGTDEVLLGCNASGGLQVLSADGNLLWRISGRTQGPHIGNVWSVDHLQGPQGPLVLIPNGNGVALFRANGTLERRFSLPHEPRYARAASPDGEPMIVTMSTYPIAVHLLNIDGSLRSTVSDPSTKRTYALDFAVSSAAPLAAATLRDGRVVVFDFLAGQRLASITVGSHGKVRWLAHNGEPRLVVGSAKGLACYRLEHHSGQAD